MTDCCEKKSCEIEALQKGQTGVLKIVLVVNAVMFVVELTAGFLSQSSALKADSLDMFGDATVYAFSLYAIQKGPIWKARAAALKGFIMAIFGVGVLVEVVMKFLSGAVPASETMGIIGVLALAANSFCLYLLFRHKSDDINMHSTWLCSRNDIIANVSVLGAAGLVSYFQSNMPDIVVGAAIACLFLSTAFHVLRDSLPQLKSKVQSRI